MNRLQEKVVVVTGASAGVGNAICRLFAAEGAKVVMFARRAERIQNTAEEINQAGGTAVAVPGDVCNQEDVEKVLKITVEKFGKVDVVVNDAGIVNYNHGIKDVPDDDCYKLFETNAMGTMRMMREAMKYMLPAGKGNFVAIGSVGGLMGHAGVAYALSKGAMVNLARQVAVDYHLEGIRSNAVCPDGILTDMAKNTDGTWKEQDPHTVAATTKHFCEGTEYCTPEQVAQVALFLASDESIAVNGQCIIVDHGGNL